MDTVGARGWAESESRWETRRLSGGTSATTTTACAIHRRRSHRRIHPSDADRNHRRDDPIPTSHYREPGRAYRES
ncbi:hypothetical protein AB0H88_13970 [Nonomuraea sp. NPDC050680]|uniref:hypothetical protein n=1 Tax=Nonomuraea sp. NPDC050680 TaxID=3154630 RepID=UPI003411D7F1